MTRLALLLALACGDLTTNVPNLTSPTCPRVEIAVYTAGPDECIRLLDKDGALFKLATSESCSGPPCVRLEPGETAYVMAKIRPGPEPVWSVKADSCDAVPECPE